MTTIAPITPEIQLQTAPGGSTPQESREQQLRIDQVIQATVSEGGLERVWLNIGQQRFLAETKIPLQTGLNLTLKVSKTSPRLEFQVLSDPLGDRIRQSLHLLEGTWSLAELSALLSDQDAINPGSQEAWARFLALQGMVAGQVADGALARLLMRLGMDYEALLAQGEAVGAATTLKRWLEDSRQASHSQEDAASEGLEHFSGLFELWQLVRLKLAHRSIEFWPLLLPQVEQGFLLAERTENNKPKGAAEASRSWRVTVHLQLPGLGPLQIDFLWERSGLFLRFQCATPEQARLFSERQEELQHFVSALPLEGVTFSLGVEAPATVLARLLAGDGVLDARV